MKLALITGGSKGLGKALVELYLENGWQVKEFSRTGTGPHHIDCDFSDSVECASTIEETFNELSKNEWSEILLINNVGTLQPIGPINLEAPRNWSTNLQVNLNSCVTATGLFIKYFREFVVPKYIANISSGAATKPYFGWSLYCASKAAMESFTCCVAIEQADEPSPVNSFIIIPGVIDTEMQDTIRSQDQAKFKNLEKFKQLKRENQLLPPEKVAKAIYTIASSSPKGGQKYDVKEYF